jgi:hypothetical protein
MPFDPNKLKGNTIVHNVVRSRVVEEGLIALPTTGSATSAPAIIRMHAPIEYLRISFCCTKVGTPPEVPSAEMLETKLKRIRGEQTAAIPRYDPENGGWIFELAGYYLYALTGVIGLDAEMATGKQPWEKSESVAFTIPAKAFTSDLLNVPLRDPLQGGSLRS